MEVELSINRFCDGFVCLELNNPVSGGVILIFNGNIL